MGDLKRFAFVMLLAACGAARAAQPFDSHASSSAPTVRACAEWYATLDAATDAGQARDRMEDRVEGFPYLRVDRFLAALRPRAARDMRALHDLVDRMLLLDVEARRHEIANLPDAAVAGLPGVPARAQAVRRTRECGRLLREIDLAIPERRTWLLERAAPRGTDAGYCEAPATTRAREPGEGLPVRLAPPGPGKARLEQAASALAEAGRSALGIPELSDREMELLFDVHAPTWEIELAGDQDRFGALRLPRGGVMPEVDGAYQAVYRHAAWALEANRVLLRLEYTIWFPDAMPQAVTWRAVLGPDGRQLRHEALQGGVCRRFALPRLALAERPRLRLASRLHEVEAVAIAEGIDGVARYQFFPYDDLRSLRDLQGGRRSAFGPGGIQ